MPRTITLSYPATCRDCGAELSTGEKVRYYSPERIYGIGCHARAARMTKEERQSSRQINSKAERTTARRMTQDQRAWDKARADL